jgi:hypothetical protein
MRIGLVGENFLHPFLSHYQLVNNSMLIPFAIILNFNTNLIGQDYSHCYSQGQRRIPILIQYTVLLLHA